MASVILTPTPCACSIASKKEECEHDKSEFKGSVQSSARWLAGGFLEIESAREDRTKKYREKRKSKVIFHKLYYFCYMKSRPVTVKKGMKREERRSDLLEIV